MCQLENVYEIAIIFMKQFISIMERSTIIIKIKRKKKENYILLVLLINNTKKI